MEILLVNPPVNRLCDVVGNYFPLGLGYLAALTNQRGFETKIYNAELDVRSLPIATNKRRIQNHQLFKIHEAGKQSIILEATDNW